MTIADGTVLGVTQIASGGPVSRRWNLVLVSDGYRTEDLPLYHAHADAFVAALRATPPFTAMWSAVNVFRVDVSSTNAGIDEPATCGDGSTGSGASVATYFDSSRCNSGTRRLLRFDTALARATAVAQVPSTTRTMLLANSSLYAGAGGNPVGGFTAAQVPASTAWETGIHELGHTAFNLADEYGGCTPGAVNRYTGVEPDQPNVTTVTSRTTTKWAAMILASTPVPTASIPDCTNCAVPASPVPAGTVGLFEDARYWHCGIYRPEYDCKMRTLGIPFCAVCQAAIRAVLTSYDVPETTTPLRIVEVAAPAINTFYDASGTVVVDDIAPAITLPGTTGAGFVQSRLFPPGQPGTPAAGMFAYLYRIDLTGIAGTGAITTLELDAGPLVQLAYAGTGPADVFVITQGGLGTVRPSTAVQTTSGRLILRFGTGVPAGQTSFFVGYTSRNARRTTAARLGDAAGTSYDLATRVPAP